MGRPVPRLLGSLSLAVAAGILAVGLAELGLAAAGARDDGCDVVGHPPRHRELRRAHEFSTTFATDELGLRSPAAPPGPGAAGPAPMRILALGDSFTEGWGVEYEDAWPARLEAALAARGCAARVANGGLAGASVIDSLRVGAMLLPKLRPTHVLLAFHANDVRESNPEARLGAEARPDGTLAWNRGRGRVRDLALDLLPRLYTLFKRAEAGRRARARAAERVPGPGGLVARLEAEAARRGQGPESIAAWRARLGPAHLALLDAGLLEPTVLGKGLLDPTWWRACLDLEGPDLEARGRAVREALDAFLGLARARGVEVLATYLPAPVQYDAATRALYASWGIAVRDAWQEGPAPVETRFASWAESSGVPWCALADGFRALPPDAAAASRFLLDGHWTPAGHARVAAGLAPWLAARLRRGTGGGP